MATIFCVHWRGPETYFIALVFGLTADCFSTLPFGIYGLSYFILSFFIRWYAIKVFLEALITLPFLVGIFTLVLNGSVLLILNTFFSIGEFSSWFSNVVFNEVIPTAVLAIPAFKSLNYLEKRYKIHLSERRF
jgi:rod shape-determining protein MreD